MDERLDILKDMRDSMLSVNHFGHAGKDAILREAADVWWPRIHREIVAKTKGCPQCSQSVKNLKELKAQNVFGKIPKPEYPNGEHLLDFDSSFQNTKHRKKYILVSVDNNSVWPDAICLPEPTADRVLEFWREYT